VPLYPDQQLHSDELLAVDAEATLEKGLAETFNVIPETITLGASASSLVSKYISANADQRVAVPHYSCQSLVDAIVDASATPVFYDIEADTSITKRAVQFAVASECSTFIWPTYFGASERDHKLQDMLHENDVVIIFDDAQADFLSVAAQQTRDMVQANDIALYSFGVSKLLAGSGGGAFYSAYDNTLSSIVKDQLSREQPKSNNAFQPDQPRFATQLELLEARRHEGSPHSRICEHDASTAISQLGRYRQSRSIHIDRYQVLRDAITENLGETALRFLNSIEDAPTILAVSVAEAKRYEILTSLSAQGIQSTWFYHPIHRVSRYRQYLAQEDDGASEVANSVVILPFQWTHSSKHVDALLDALRKIGGN
jgi:dTDP-4-amino-4,6-dideoxygalactose transaminase